VPYIWTQSLKHPFIILYNVDKQVAPAVLAYRFIKLENRLLFLEYVVSVNRINGHKEYIVLLGYLSYVS